MASNSSGGRPASASTVQREWDALDALPRSVRAAMWDGMRDWDALTVSDHVRRFGDRQAILLVQRWDAEEREKRLIWIARHQRRPGTRRHLLPPSPAQAAEATQVRSHARLYRIGR
jgi:hypothetical protein